MMKPTKIAEMWNDPPGTGQWQRLASAPPKAVECPQLMEIPERCKISKFMKKEAGPLRQVCSKYGMLCAMVILWSCPNAVGQDRSQTRSMVVSRMGIVAAESPLAAEAGVRILEGGGNAVDAAIATNAMMGLVSPMMNGMGGDLFAIVYDAKANKLYGLNASGWAPKGLTIESLHKLGLREMPQTGVQAITVPGAVDGWQKLADKFGRKKLSED